MSIPIKTLTLPISSGGSTTETEYSFITPEDMDQKANVDGYYENLVSGGTEQLLSSVYEEDNEPYLFRTSGGSIDIGDREEDTIVGGTVAWNQLVGEISSPITKSFSGDSDYGGVIGSMPNSVPAIKDHVYFLMFDVERTIATNNYVGVYVGGVSTGLKVIYDDGTPNGVRYGILKALASEQLTNFTYNNYYGKRKMEAGDSITINNAMCIDITQLFSTSAIGDYIYSLEQTNVGVGVALFKKYFSKLYTYNAGSLKSVEGLTAHEMVGFNAYNDVTGTAKLVGGMQYQITGTYTSVSYEDVSGNAETLTIDNDGYFTPSANGILTVTGGNATDTCVHLVWDGERDGDYESYIKRSYPLDSSLELRGVFKLVNGKLKCDGDIYHSDGTVERKYGIVDLGTLNWESSSIISGINAYQVYFGLINKTGYTNASVFPLVCTKYTSVPFYANGVYMANADKCIAYAPGGGSRIYITDNAYQDASAFKTAMSGVYLVYELATPTTEEVEPFVSPQIVDDFGTEEYVTDSIVPVGHETKYQPNLRAKLEMAPDSPSDNGDYIVRHTNGRNEYVPLVIPTELPTTPSEDGTYHLKVTVTDGTAVLSWEGE